MHVYGIYLRVLIFAAIKFSTKTHKNNVAQTFFFYSITQATYRYDESWGIKHVLVSQLQRIPA